MMHMKFLFFCFFFFPVIGIWSYFIFEIWGNQELFFIFFCDDEAAKVASEQKKDKVVLIVCCVLEAIIIFLLDSHFGSMCLKE